MSLSVQETTFSSLSKAKCLLAHLNSGILAGVTRAVVFELAAKLSIRAVERELIRHDIYTADECFLTGTAAEVIPAVQLDRRLIGNGQPGPITLRLIESFRELTRATGTPIYE